MPETPSILIVDDSRDKLVALESILVDLRVNIVKARSGKEALRRLLAEDFAVVLLDVRMPGMDGFETATLIRERSKTAHTPIIFSTAFGDETHVARGYSLKAVDYILTPVVPDVLRTKVSVFVELFRATMEVKRQADTLRQRAAQLHRLAASSLAINAALSLDQMLSVLVASAREILGAQRALAVARVDERRTHRAVSAASAIPDAEDIDVAAPLAAYEMNRAWRATRLVHPHGAGLSADGDGDGALETYDVLAAPFTGRDGRNLGLVKVFADGDRSFTQEDEDLLVQLAQMTSIAIENALFSEAREANTLKEEFLSTVSHELRTPLSAMLSWLWMLRRKELDPEAAARAISAVERNARAQARLVDDLLDVSRIMTGKLHLDCHPLEVGPVVEAATDSLAAAAEAKAITLARSIGAAAVEEARAAEVPCSLEGLRVLLVEDEVDAREALSAIVSQAGATVAAVGTAGEALGRLVSWRPDVLVCDIGLPAEDGYALIRKVRALRPDQGGDVPAVALTAYARASDRARALAAGFQVHLAKPLEPDQLLRVLARSAQLPHDADHGKPGESG